MVVNQANKDNIGGHVLTKVQIQGYTNWNEDTWDQRHQQVLTIVQKKFHHRKFDGNSKTHKEYLQPSLRALAVECLSNDKEWCLPRMTTESAVDEEEILRLTSLIYMSMALYINQNIGNEDEGWDGHVVPTGPQIVLDEELMPSIESKQGWEGTTLAHHTPTPATAKWQSQPQQQPRSVEWDHVIVEVDISVLRVQVDTAVVQAGQFVREKVTSYSLPKFESALLEALKDNDANVDLRQCILSHRTTDGKTTNLLTGGGLFSALKAYEMAYILNRDSSFSIAASLELRQLAAETPLVITTNSYTTSSSTNSTTAKRPADNNISSSKSARRRRLNATGVNGASGWGLSEEARPLPLNCQRTMNEIDCPRPTEKLDSDYQGTETEEDHTPPQYRGQLRHSHRTSSEPSTPKPSKAKPAIFCGERGHASPEPEMTAITSQEAHLAGTTQASTVAGASSNVTTYNSAFLDSLETFHGVGGSLGNRYQRPQMNVTALDTSTSDNDQQTVARGTTSSAEQTADLNHAVELDNDQRAKIYFLPMKYQSDSRVREQHVLIEDLSNPEEVEKKARFHKVDFSDPQTMINVLDFDKVPTEILEPGRVAAASKSLTDSEPKVESASISRKSNIKALEHWTLDEFSQIIRLFKLDERNDNIWHGRAKMHFPGMGRTPQFVQLYCAGWIVRTVYVYGIAWNGDGPGIGKTTEQYIVWLIMIQVTEMLQHMEDHPEEHLPQGPEYTERNVAMKCPSSHKWCLQCCCEPKGWLTASIAKKMPGPKVDFNNARQMVNPSINENWAMQQPDGVWREAYKNEGIGNSGKIEFRVNHPFVLKSSPPERQRAFEWRGHDDFEQFAPKYVFNVSSFPAIDRRDQFLSYFETGHDEEDLETGEINYAKLSQNAPGYRYVHPARANRWIISTTQRYAANVGKLLGIKKLVYGAVTARGGQNMAVEQRRTFETHNSPVHFSLCSVDEGHTMAGEHSPINTFLTSQHNEFKGFRGYDPTRLLINGGTPLSENAWGRIAVHAKMIQTSFTDPAWPGPGEDFNWLDAEYLRKRKNKLVSIRKKVDRTLEERSSGKGCGVLDTATKAELAEENKLATKHLPHVVIQRTVDSEMFGHPIGLPLKISWVEVKTTQETLTLVNEPAKKCKADIERRIQDERRKEKDETKRRAALSLMSEIIIGNKRTQIASVLTGFAKLADQVFSERQEEYARNDKEFNHKEGERTVATKWSELSELQQNEKCALTFNNGEAISSHILTTWPLMPYLWFLKWCHTAFRYEEKDAALYKKIMDAHVNGDAKAMDENPPTEKFLHIAIFCAQVWKREKACGIIVSQNTYVVEFIRALAWIHFSDRNSPLFIHDEAKYHFINIAAGTFAAGGVRGAAVTFADGQESEFRKLHMDKVKEAALQEGIPEWVFDTSFIPRFMTATTVLAEGVSLSRFGSMMMTEPFARQDLITQTACRSHRTTNQEAAEVTILKMKGSANDDLAAGRYQGSDALAKAYDDTAKMLGLQIE